MDTSRRFEEEKMEISTTYTDAWRETNNVPDSDAIEAPPAAELEGEEPLMFHKHPQPQDSHHPQRNIDRHYFYERTTMRQLEVCAQLLLDKA
jgi:hypothetical protein